MTQDQSPRAGDGTAAGAVLVPVTATDDMLIAGQEAWMCTDAHHPAMEDCKQAQAVWDAMLAAAPAAAPLSERAILDLVPSTMPIANDFDLLWFARALERAHGIQAPATVSGSQA